MKVTHIASCELCLACLEDITGNDSLPIGYKYGFCSVECEERIVRFMGQRVADPYTFTGFSICNFGVPNNTLSFIYDSEEYVIIIDNNYPFVDCVHHSQMRHTQEKKRMGGAAYFLYLYKELKVANIIYPPSSIALLQSIKTLTLREEQYKQTITDLHAKFDSLKAMYEDFLNMLGMANGAKGEMIV